jgi:arylsulfatase
MNYSFADAAAPTTHITQYYEMLGNRGLYHDGWKIATYHGRKPWENQAAWGFDEDRWELYNLAEDPAEANDLMAGRDRANLDDPVVKQLLELVSLWWAEAGRYQVLPLDDRFFVRALGREGLYAERETMTLYEGAVRIQPFEAPQTLNRSWEMTAHIEVPAGGAEGPIVAMAGDSSGWSLYLKDSVPTFCYNYPGPERTYVRAAAPLPPGAHAVRFVFEKTGPEPMGAGGTARLFADDAQVAEGHIPRTCTVGYTMDETFDVGWDKGTPVSEDYGANARFTGRVQRVDFDLKPDVHPAATDPAAHAAGKLTQALLRQ